MLKIEETVDYLLLERGELVAMSYAFPHPSLEFPSSARASWWRWCPTAIALAGRERVSVRELAREPLVGVSPAIPTARSSPRPFARAGVDYRLSIRARFAQTVVSLVRHGLGVA